MSDLLPLLVYLTMWLVTAVLVARAMAEDVSNDTTDLAMCGMLGVMLGLLWPVVWAGAGVMRIVRIIEAQNK